MDWEELYSNNNITVLVASPEALLAMKVNASRPGRDVQDIANLLAICNVTNLEEISQIMNKYYPGDGISEKAERLLIPIFEQGVPVVPARPRNPVLGFDLT